ncbi:hypothetical protein F2Q69_00035560 [Brassica cretica]|uniref:Uncharacterized protein n=1 Tax=Brassica cretica TaxID=69181 RepID=A0A8S9SIU0_BRACR|nr:hypothetical protein F2Q69_00035560 [Brassica cretica]
MKLHEEKKLTLVIRPQHRSTPPSHRRSTPAPPKRSTPRPHHRSSSPPHCRYHHLIVDTTSSALIDADSCYLSTPLEIPERSSCPQDIADSAQKGTDVPSYYPSQYVEKVITIEDFLELEEFLELDDGEQLGDLDSSREVIMEDFLELEEWLDSEKKLEVSQRRGLRFRCEVDNGPTEAVSRDTNKPTSIDITTSPSIDTSRESEQNEYEVCGNLFDGETTTRSDNSGGNKKRNWKKRKRTKGGSQLSLISRFSDGVRKSRVRNRCFSQPFTKLRALLIAEMIDKRRRVYGGGFHTIMIKLQRADIETCFGACSHSHPD